MKTVFVTGANRGLGKGFTQYFLGIGYKVFAGVRDTNSVDLKLSKNPNFYTIKINVSDDESIQSAYEEIKKQTTSLDYLINNAGLNKDSATNNKKELVCNLNNLDRMALLNMFNVNSISPLIITKYFLPLLSVKPSFVINISSARSSYNDENPNSNGNYGYRASKAALNMMTYCTLFDLPPNVKTFTVHPGSVRTDMNPNGIDEPMQQAEKIINITENWKDELNGKFLRFDGTVYPL